MFDLMPDRNQSLRDIPFLADVTLPAPFFTKRRRKYQRGDYGARPPKPPRQNKTLWGPFGGWKPDEEARSWYRKITGKQAQKVASAYLSKDEVKVLRKDSEQYFNHMWVDSSHIHFLYIGPAFAKFTAYEYAAPVAGNFVTNVEEVISQIRYMRLVGSGEWDCPNRVEWDVIDPFAQQSSEGVSNG